MKSFFMLLVILLVYLGSTLSVQAEYRIVSEKGQFGVVDTYTGEFVIKPNYQQIIKSHDVFIVKRKYEEIYHDSKIVGKGRKSKSVTTTKIKLDFEFGVINTSGEVLIPIDYDIISGMSIPGIFMVGEGEPNKKYGLININNEILVPIMYDEIRVVSSGKKGEKVFSGPPNHIVVEVTKNHKAENIEINLREKPALSKFKKGDRYGFKKGDGQELVGPIFEDAWDFQNGFARVKKDGKWGLIDEQGALPFPPRYNYVWDFNDGKAKVRLDDGSIRYVDATGKETEN